MADPLRITSRTMHERYESFEIGVGSNKTDEESTESVEVVEFEKPSP